jgi:hypothetical protein
MPSTYMILQPLHRAMFTDVTEDQWREMMAWNVTEQVKGLGYTPTARPPAVDWWPMSEIEAASLNRRQPGWDFQPGDMTLRARIEVAEDVPPETMLAGPPP